MPIMSIYAYLTIVVVFAVGAPNSLEVKHVKVHVDIVLFDHLYGKLALIVRERTVFLVLTLGPPRIKIRRTELGFVLIGVIELLDTIMSPLALVTFATVGVLASDMRTDF